MKQLCMFKKKINVGEIMGMKRLKQINTSSLMGLEGVAAVVRCWHVPPQKDDPQSSWDMVSVPKSCEAQNSSWNLQTTDNMWKHYLQGIIPENMLGLSSVTIDSFPGYSVWAKQTFPSCRGGKLVKDSGYCGGQYQAGLFSFSSSDEIK